jgi:hypothetical protein
MLFPNNKFAISMFLRAARGPKLGAMFLIQRSFSAVMAALGVALLIVFVDRACAGQSASTDERTPAQAACAACAAHIGWGIVRAGS